MKRQERILGHTIAEWEDRSAELDREFSGSIENTQPLTPAERKWYEDVVRDRGPKVKVTIRLRKWQIARARQLAKKRGLRGYQTLLDQIITDALLPGGRGKGDRA